MTIMQVRRYRRGEEEEMWSLYFNTAHQIWLGHYTSEQIERWAPRNKDLLEWKNRLLQKDPFVAVVNGQIVGFAELDLDGHIDMFYGHVEWQRKGVGTQLLAALENEARRLSLSEIFAESSSVAVEFFKAKGFDVTEVRENIVCGSPAKQFIIRKKLRLE